MLGDLWDVLMGTLPTRDEAAGHMALLSRCFSSLHRHEKCQLLPQLASSFIPRRVEEFLPPTNSHQDPDDTFDVTSTASPTTTSTHHTQPPPLCRRSQRGSNIFNPREYRKTSSRLGKSSLVRGASNSTNSHQLMVQRKPSEVRKGGTALGVAAFRRKSTRVHDVVLPPDQLHGILPLVGYRHHHPRQSTAPPPLMTKPSLLAQYEEEPDTSAELLEFLDELADDLKEIYALLRVGEYRSQQSGMHDLAQLLTTRLHVTLDDEGMSDPKDKERTAVTTIVQMLKAHPSALGSVLKHVPDLVVDTLRVQQGILKYVMVHCSRVVGQFLKLDEVAADTWQAIVKAQSKKQLTLLWSTDQDAGTENEEEVVSPVEAAYQWLQSHVTDTAKVLLLNHDMAKLIFAAMEREVELAAKGATNKGLRLKMLLTELDDLPTFQAHTHLATQKGLEMAMKHDMKGMVTLLTIILSNNTHLKDLVTSSVEFIAALAMHNKHALINLLNSDVATWKPFFMQAMTQHAFLLTDWYPNFGLLC
ncbi:hypothetical protein DYB30_004411 [Aphanomyces astaci]|uniref:Uncharacterized protein n=1 Tax=Aphanomyces astaci TaxID=112090 RepID=A0A397DDE4_APHAT|nr:hypothetical protein DYB30_004411 [Aphanomyces astaci]